MRTVWQTTKYDLTRYLKRVKLLVENEFPHLAGKELYKVERDVSRKVISVTPTLERVPVSEEFGYLQVAESLVLPGKDRFSLSAFNYHMQPKAPEDMEWRVHKEDSTTPSHANTDERVHNSIGNHLEYPTGTELEIADFCLYYALVVALTYLRTGEYPLEPDNCDKYNKVIRRLRKLVVVREAC